ncbi:thiol:disulfide interchange protein DsbA/DsbL [Oceanimonas baumannii]|uniref:Thiol:disulfide interchange protein n=1 Tax=Oceanimonas baumannii TaxID=129578 RepID=A0A235CIJ3_9GAMM|nr:thiol:disulfide interchange protein DsbA/DsbL [Oceanimonas baumannii]OYD24219.1 thiol:disulfide interchange protein [Oceanimonas baumannii]TDW58945.1 thiol:disulfide interchange protein DsbA [Oceanimonas baumannii]
MKKLIFAFITMLFVPLAHAAPEFKEGVEYSVVSEIAGSKPEVTEFFSYICPHCYSFQPLMDKLAERVPEAEINKVPVSFLGKDLGPVLQRAYGAAKLLKVEDKLTPVMFDRIHRQKKVPGSIDDVKEVFVANGVDGKDFDGVINSFALNGMISKYDKLTEKFNIRGTPTVIVRNKYQLNMGEIGSEERFYRVVEYLLSAD